MLQFKKSPRLAETLLITRNAIDYNKINFANGKSKSNIEKSLKSAKLAKEKAKIKYRWKISFENRQNNFLVSSS